MDEPEQTEESKQLLQALVALPIEWTVIREADLLTLGERVETAELEASENLGRAEAAEETADIWRKRADARGNLARKAVRMKFALKTVIEGAETHFDGTEPYHKLSCDDYEKARQVLKEIENDADI